MMGAHGIRKNGVLSVVVLRGVILRWVRIVLLLLLLRHVNVHLPGRVVYVLNERLHWSNTVNLLCVKVSHVVVGHHAWLLSALGFDLVNRCVWSAEVQVHAQISVFRCIKMSLGRVVVSVAYVWA